MSADVIRETLLGDLTSVAASSISASYPELFADATEVPAFLYTSLKDIWVGVSAASSEYARRVIAYYGEGKTVASGDIEIIPMVIKESADVPSGWQDDTPGAETAVFAIKFAVPRTTTSYDKVRDAALRTRYLLDNDWRSRRGENPQLTIAGDLTINKNGHFRCFWLGDDGSNASEYISNYKLEYLRVYFP